MRTEPASAATVADPYAEDPYAIDLDGPRVDDPHEERPEPDHPDRVWVLLPAERVPPNGLDYRRADLVPVPNVAPAPAAPAADNTIQHFLRAVTGILEALPIVAASSKGGGDARMYSTANLPPGVTENAFSEAVRKKRVPAAKIGGRKFVRVADWESFVATCVARKAAPAPANATDDDLLRSVGRPSRRRR